MPPGCPASLAAFPDGIRLCRCAPAALRTGPVHGDGFYAAASAPCRAGLHAGVIGPRGGDLLIRVLPLAGETPGARRHRIASEPGRLEGRAYRLLAATPGQVAWARRLAEALAAPNPGIPRLAGRAEEPVPLPLPQAAGPEPLLPAAPERAGFGSLVPPVLMPALWRMPVRPPDAPLPEGRAPPPVAAALPPPAAPGPVAGPAEAPGPARLLVSGVPVDLAAVEPGEGTDPRLPGQFLARRGGYAHCLPVPGAPGHRCTTGDGIDLAEAALYNGLARASPAASDAYRYAEQAAREAGRGIWKAETR
ncbi:LCCL domain-containing protein [Roseicella aerolata]|uniref:LCCL domain-containing protein n=1 Tax=Roseicella aerolata TaxID=2883479 RepID=UPI0030844323